MPSPCWPAVLLVQFALGQAAETPLPQPLNIPAAVQQLGDPKFEVREAATQALWLEANEAQPALTAALKHDDAEVRLRAAKILDHFQRGIYPDTLPESLGAIAVFNRDQFSQGEGLRALKEAGDWKSILRLLSVPRSEDERERLSHVVRSELEPSIVERVRVGDFGTAKHLLTLLATPDPNDPTVNADERRRLAIFRWQTGELPARVALLEKQAALPAVERWELVTLHELSGDYQKARAAAKDIDDVLLQLRLAECAGDWSSAARLYDHGFAVKAAFYRLARDEPSYRECVEQMRAAVKPKTPNDQAQRIADALFILGETDAGLMVVQDRLPRLAFQLLAARHDYDAAFAIAKLRKDIDIDRAWLNGLPLEKFSKSPPMWERCHFAGAVAVQLHNLGEDEAARKIGDLLVAVLDEALANPAESKGGFARIAVDTLFKTGRTDDADALAARLLDRKLDPFSSVQPLFDAGYESDGDCLEWFAYLSRHFSDKSHAERIVMLRRIIAPPNKDEFWREMVEHVQNTGFVDPGEEAPPLGSISRRTGIQLCERHRRFDLALAIAESAEKKESAGWQMVVGNLHVAAGHFREAERHYRVAASDEEHGRVGSYLVGVMLDRQGKTKDARAWKITTLLHHGMQRDQPDELVPALKQRGLNREAADVAAKLLRMSDGYELQYDQTLGNHLAETDPLAAARHFETIRRGFLGSGNLRLTDPDDFIEFPHIIARVRARGYLANGQIDDALRELADCRRILPRDPGLAERFVPLLAAAGKKAEADALFDEVIAAQEKICAAWPRAAAHHNAIAWTSARCERRLDEALAHALAATKLRPTDAALLDTLAEVYFVRGEIAKAVVTQRRAVDLAPGVPLFKTRLVEFEAAARGETPKRTFRETKDEV